MERARGICRRDQRQSGSRQQREVTQEALIITANTEVIARDQATELIEGRRYDLVIRRRVLGPLLVRQELNGIPLSHERRLERKEILRSLMRAR